VRRATRLPNCRTHGKTTWATRRAARRAARRYCPGEKGLNEYRCDHGDGWHFGHLGAGGRQYYQERR
jgi:hypothetical protein